ncbi:MAG TPA: matrixin family metalloprotease [Thermoanaerobaculia bacterium]|nr:matrixin family metalloprotease [Thermoanaerobaculia bacterium]
MTRILATAALALLVTAADARAAARLTYELSSGPTAIEWPPGAFPLPVTIGRSATQNLPAGEELIRRAFDSWEGRQGSRVAFRHEGLTDARAGQDGVNVVTTNDELYQVSGFLAFTTTWFDDQTGHLLEADIQIDASATKEGIGLQTLVEHEIGHLLGFDHSGVVSSIMYPWVGSENLPGLDSDDQVLLASVYPNGAGKSGLGTLRGSVSLPGGGVMGAHVVAVDSNGSPVAGTLSGADGSFEIAGLPAGAYRIYAEPLDGPVQATNLSGVWRGAVTSFRTEFGRPVEVRDGQITDRVEVRVFDLPNELNPRWIGAFEVSSPEVRLSSTALTVRAGTTMEIAIGGEGVIGGLTEFEVLNPGFERISEFNYATNYLWARYRIAPGAPAGSVVILARNGEETATLTGALRVDASPGGRQRLARR